jgi:hypothetical protein
LAFAHFLRSWGAVPQSSCHKESGGNPENIGKNPLKTQTITKNALTGPAHRPGEKGEKKTPKNMSWRQIAR